MESSEASYLWALGDDFHAFPFIRQVLGLCILPDLKPPKDIPEDICRLATSFISLCSGGSIGSYNGLEGMHNTKEIIEDYISERDNINYSDEGRLLIAAGTELAFVQVLPLLPGCHKGGTHAILVPGPTIPPIIDSIEVAGFKVISYYLSERDDNWTLDDTDLLEAIEGSPYPAMCMFVQNPGYPTGHIYSTEELQRIIRFAKKQHLVIVALEELQLDVYDPDERPFVSMRKVLLEMGSDYKSVQLLSFFSPNKSIIGEPGMSVSYVDTLRLGSDVFEALVELINSPPVLEQFYMTLFLNPRAIRDETSFKEFNKEKQGIIKRIGRICKMVTDFFNSQPYITCTRPRAGQTVFPKLEFPQSWTYIGPRSSASLEEFYCQQLREATKLPIVAGKYFNEFPGSSHFKFSFPLDEIKLLQMLDQFKSFHQNFIMTMVK